MRWLLWVSCLSWGLGRGLVGWSDRVAAAWLCRSGAARCRAPRRVRGLGWGAVRLGVAGAAGLAGYWLCRLGHLGARLWAVWGGRPSSIVSAMSRGDDGGEDGGGGWPAKLKPLGPLGGEPGGDFGGAIDGGASPAGSMEGRPASVGVKGLAFTDGHGRTRTFTDGVKGHGAAASAGGEPLRVPWFEIERLECLHGREMRVQLAGVTRSLSEWAARGVFFGPVSGDERAIAESHPLFNGSAGGGLSAQRLRALRAEMASQAEKMRGEVGMLGSIFGRQTGASEDSACMAGFGGGRVRRGVPAKDVPMLEERVIAVEDALLRFSGQPLERAAGPIEGWTWWAPEMVAVSVMGPVRN
jgi:hypothetical protein